MWFLLIVAVAAAAGLLTAAASGAPEHLLTTSSAEQQAKLQRQNIQLRAQIARERKKNTATVARLRTRHQTNLGRARKHSRAVQLRSPGVDHALRLASATYGVSYARLRSVARCESGLRPHAKGGQYVGLFQFGLPLWNGTPYRAFDRSDPYASALAGARAFSLGMASHWPVCGR
ncbi:MAG: hypothetical protein OEM67_02145 [Thermoleophilia bacterium]|nr:hypothetical protein [Thermoleophilia bacterium]